MSIPMIEIVGLTKAYGQTQALRGISFEVPRGQVVGFLGPNGAGKSTTIKMLTGILVPSGGRVAVAGLDPSRRRIELARRIGAMFGQRIQLWWDLPLVESFELLRHIYRVPRDRYQANLARRLEAPFAGDPWPLFRRLRTGDPALFAGYLDLGPSPAVAAGAACVAGLIWRYAVRHYRSAGG